MGLALARSYEKARNRIKDTGCCWVQGFNGLWHHTFDKKIVQDRIAELNCEIDWHYAEGAERDRSKWEWDPVT